MNLKHLTDHSLRKDSHAAALREKERTTVLLHHIKEVDRRKLYSDWKFSSLFDWCVKELGLCEGSAHLRITAARLLDDIPEIEKKIEQGVLNLTNISQVNQFCRENNVDSIDEKKNILNKVENLSKKETEKKLFEMSGKKKKGRESKKRISKNEHKATYILSDETIEALEEIKKLLGKKISSDELIKLMCSALKEKIEKTKFKQTDRPRTSQGTKGRVIPAEVKRKVYARDKTCTKCGSIHNLNFDHHIPFSLGGGNTVDNIRLLCFHCNQRARILMGFTSSG